jgi:hypothetical protein
MLFKRVSGLSLKIISANKTIAQIKTAKGRPNIIPRNNQFPELTDMLDDASRKRR